LVLYSKQWQIEFVKFLALEEGESLPDDVLMVDKEGEWEMQLHQQRAPTASASHSPKLWQSYFMPNTSQWFKQEAGDVLLAKKYARNQFW
jgi:hypothetical protein